MPRKKLDKGLVAKVFDTKGALKKTIDLPKEIFGVQENNILLAQAVRVYLANQRQGTVSTKTRGEVAGSTRKIYRQKGTGRARHGSIRAPIFVHGGVAFGPKPRDFSLSLTKPMKRNALFCVLSSKYKDEKTRFVAGLEKIAPKTKEMVTVLHNLKLDKKEKNLLIVTSEYLQNVYKAARNIKGVKLEEAYKLNAYAVLNSDTVLFMEASLDVLQRTFRKKE
ncbi:MAG: 50S ribosomal protein L4 [Candidatus Levybacteria bacterium RIFCSPHIGHO2_02_FULL_42_12]|nr:MAG: 50S ribosomal protein L4 [Candidatus Levybacteria bacterium RIFCSPHIGHO2_01_FULL_42_15]OGH31413.1 MAG: 50S ribosomal protein L4 [Candidatus Levybacteria bacterium RIFCSPHIGHO2_02_FULL_42_12]OGH42676.1 MAG: 50S ribosomal protein L4 [Candidatus Levybacteria bacterium RIFCSPLOWO2_01_FULL_42_15]